MRTEKQWRQGQPWGCGWKEKEEGRRRRRKAAACQPSEPAKLPVSADPMAGSRSKATLRVWLVCPGLLSCFLLGFLTGEYRDPGVSPQLPSSAHICVQPLLWLTHQQGDYTAFRGMVKYSTHCFSKLFCLAISVFREWGTERLCASAQDEPWWTDSFPKQAARHSERKDSYKSLRHQGLQDLPEFLFFFISCFLLKIFLNAPIQLLF